MLKIAICDDSRTDIEMLESAFDKLCQYPIEYDVYFSGKELLMCSMQDKENYHLYIFDIEMPDMDGFQTLEELRKVTDAPVVFVTAYKDYKFIERARDMGVEDYITKPFLPIVFLETLYGIIG